MEPGTEQYGSRPDRPRDREFRGFDDRDRDERDDWENGNGSGNGNGGAAVAATPKARLGLLLLLAFAIEFVVIVGLGNQWVADKITKLDPSTFMGAGLRRVALVFAWRFTPRSSDHDHLWLAGLMLIVATIVLSLLLITAVCRGPVTWGRAFFGSWMAVTVATMLGGYVRSAVVDTHAQGQGGRYEQALFGTVSPGSVVFLAGLLLGLIVAIVLGIVGPLTRRLPEGAVAAGYSGTPTAAGSGAGAGAVAGADTGPAREPASAPGGAPWQDQYYGPPAPRGAVAAPPPFHGDDPDSQRTTQLPVGDADRPGGATALGQQREQPADQPVAQPAPESAEQREQRAPEPAEEATQALPVQQRPADADAPTGPQAPAERPTERPTEDATQALPVHEHPAQQEPPQQQPVPEQAAQQPAEQQPVEQQPAEQPAQQQPAQQQPVDEQPHQTARFPRPPDDEDLDPEH